MTTPPKTTTILRQNILEGLDPRLAGLGFQRGKNTFEWLRRRSDVLHGIHLNFAVYESVGRVAIIPTLEVGLGSVERALAEAAQKPYGKLGCSFVGRLTTLLSREYVATVQEGPAPVVARLGEDIERHGLPHLERMSSLEQLSELLLASNPRDWPTSLGLSSRARLLPLVLALRGQVPEAQGWLTRLRQELKGRDTLKPDIDSFAEWFQRRFGPGT